MLRLRGDLRPERLRHRLQTARAEFHGLATDAPRLEVGELLPFGRDVRVAAGVASVRSAAAAIANSCHNSLI